MSYDENERAAYMAGDTVTADLYHRLDQLTQALGETLAELEGVKLELTRAGRSRRVNGCAGRIGVIRGRFKARVR